MNLGASAEVSRTFSHADIKAYAALGDAADSDVVPEPMIAALFSYLLGVKLPGAGTNYLKQSLEFLHPGHPDTRLTARVEITRLRPEKALADLETTCKDDTGRLICRGRALVRIKDVGAE